MSLSFSNTKGKAVKNQHPSFEYKDGENTVRIFGDILPRYVYWVKGSNNKDIPIECLAFDRDLEKFANKEVDHVPDFYPEKKCSWAYSVNCLDPKDGGKVKILNLKKKLFEQVQQAAEDLGDPTNAETGWDLVFKRTKTGPAAFNVEYNLSVLRCKPRALTPEELEAIAGAESIEIKVPRPTAEEVKTNLERLAKGNDSDVAPEGTDSEAVNELSR